MRLPSFPTCRYGCIVAYGVRCRPQVTISQKLQSLLPVLASRTRTDGCTVAGRVRPDLLKAHALEKSNCMLLLPSFLTCRNGCAAAYGVWCRPHPAVFQQLQGLLPALALRTRTDSSIVAARIKPFLCHR